MSKTGGNGLQIIQQSFQEAERLLNRRQYNLSMVKTRQTLEFMVRYLGERACIVDTDLMDTINQLYEGRWIAKSTQEHYHKIRIIGNKAVHDGDRSPDNANQAYQLLSQEVKAFSQTYVHGKPRPAGSKSNAGAGRNGRSARSGSSPRSGARRRKRKPPMAYYLIKFLVPVFLVIVLVTVIWAFGRKRDKAPAPTPPETSVTIAVTQPPETLPPATPSIAQTVAPTEVSAIYKAVKNVNVRPKPSTDGKPLATIKAGAAVEYVREYDSKWSVIMYNGKEAYISTDFLIKE